jgi:hypothetical protein
MILGPDGKPMEVAAVVCPLCNRPAVRVKYDRIDIGIIACPCVKDTVVMAMPKPEKA